LIEKREESPRRMRRPPRWHWFALPVVLVVAIAGTVAAVVLHHPGEPVPVATVLARYRHGTGGDAGGVYVYDTTGSEGVDALSGGSHDYPARTTMTVTPAAGDCLDVRWDALAQRWDDEQLCPAAGGGWTRPRTTEFHSFFGQDETRTSTCTGTDVVPPPDPGAGATTWTCDSPGTGRSGPSHEDGRRNVVGEGHVIVAGTTRAALHVRYTTTVSGDTTGGGTVDRWYSLDRYPLLLREIIHETDRSHTVIGTVRYHEDVALTLAAWEPRR